MWNKKVREDSIPAAERVYCPYPNCSMLMSKTELSSSAGSDQSSVRECVKCNGLFCMDCKVPSHTDLSCADYKKLHPDTLVDDMKLKSLAEDKKWRLCVKCRNMIELSHGCNHMTCRCGYEFCYKCGTEWNKNKQSCPSGCQLTGLGDYDIEDDDDSEHTCETDMCQCYYDENGRRFRNYEEYIDRQIVQVFLLSYYKSFDSYNSIGFLYLIYVGSCSDYPMPPLPPLPPGEVQEYEQFDIVEGNGDDYDDDYYNYGGLTESDDEGGFSEAFFIDYYSL
ncbi:unnamed protein product [Microthlaspi erraticum]|uniref:RBR-type E3 ubiquitin transferase n=1 Tax=Microthlaspi erraticum TaxID=1685480 RepID=A0A6D2IZC6_9BRAS|nr:unnamed protein product [Microthlaspi erraticum]